MNIEFFVRGRPGPGGSKTGFPNPKTGGVIMSPASTYTKPWMEAVKFAALDAIPDNFQLLLGAVKVTVNFVIQRPKNHYGTGKNSNILKHSAPKMFHTQKPDAAKLYRSTEDALTGILWKDDCQVAVVGLAKYWTDSVKGTEHQGCKIAVEPLQKKEN